MTMVQPKARFDWLVELGGASALAVAAGYAALKAAPVLALPAPAAMTASGFGFFAFGLLAMRVVKPDPQGHALPPILIEPIETAELLLDQVYPDELLLDDLAEDEALLLDQIVEDEALLLDDLLAAPNPDSRVVQLFASQPLPTPGQLCDRIDRHLAGAPRRAPADIPPPPPDATDALFAALSELRRSLS